MKIGNRIRTMTQVSLLAAIMLALMFSGIGYIPIGPVRATTMHIPVIIGGILLGPLAGAILGGIFGVTSVIQNTFTPTFTSFVFSPFYSMGEYSGNMSSLVIAILPRILIGVVAALVFRAIAKGGARQTIACMIAGIAASLTNTILVMLGIFIFFGESYASAKNIAYDTLIAALAAIIGTNGVIEAIVAGIIAFAVCRPLMAMIKRKL